MTRASIQTTLIFVGLGPAVGLLTFLGLISVFALQTMSARDILSDASALSMPGLIIGYAIGAGPALISAAVTIWIGKWGLKHEVWHVAGSAMLIGVGYTLIWPELLQAITVAPPAERYDLYSFAILVPTCLMPTMLCWSLSKRLTKPIDPSIA